MDKPNVLSKDSKEYELLLKDQTFAHKIREQRKLNTSKRNAKLMIYKLKAESKGITVTDSEIDKYMSENK